MSDDIPKLEPITRRCDIAAVNVLLAELKANVDEMARLAAEIADAARRT